MSRRENTVYKIAYPYCVGGYIAYKANKCRNFNKCQGCGKILTGEAKMKERNYGDKVDLANNLAVLDHSHGMFVIVLRCSGTRTYDYASGHLDRSPCIKYHSEMYSRDTCTMSAILIVVRS